jgi:hypothetical protein
MAQKTNLNAAPYFDDFSAENNYHRILFRPGFAVQARELTQLQSALQHQIEAHGSHIFRDGAQVVPGNTQIQSYNSLKLASTFNSEQVDPSQYYNEDTPVTITGATTGVTAKVIGFKAATTTEQPLLYISYERSGSDFETTVFADGENISANTTITHSTQQYTTGVESVATYTSEYTATNGATAAQLASAEGPAARKGSAYRIESGVYYVRGFFVNNIAETLVLDSYSTEYTGEVGFKVTETIVTPENETSLLDNATGSSNFAAKGAHRLSISLSLTKKTSTTDTSDFIILSNIEDGKSEQIGRSTQYSVLADEMARRTNDESGSYTVRPFQFRVEESIDTNVSGTSFQGTYSKGETTKDNNTANESLLSFIVSRGKAYIEGFEIEKTNTSIKDVNKARDFETLNATVSTFDMGNYALITNVFGTPDITNISGESTAFKTVEFYDAANTTRGSKNGNLIGVGRARAIEYHSGDVGANSDNTDSQYKLYMFDIRPFTKLTLSDTPSPTLLATHTNGGVLVTGVTSGATGFVHKDGTSSASVNLTTVVGNFQVGEKITASDSAEASAIIENSGNTDLTILAKSTFSVSNFKQVFMDDEDSGQDFTADFVTSVSTNIFADIVLEEDVNSSIELEQATTSSGRLIQEGFDTDLVKLFDAEKNRALFKLPKNVVKTLLTATNSGASDTQYTLRRQFVGTTNSSGVVTFQAGTNETFAAHAEKDYTLSILTAGGGTGVQGDVVTLDSKLSGTGSASLTVTDNTILGSAAKVKLTATLLKTSVIQKSKTTNLMKQLKVVSGTTDAFGTRPTDTTISLGRADAFNVVAVFDSESSSTDAVAPEMTLTNAVGTFERGEEIVGGTSGAKARVIDISSPINYVQTTNVGFTSGETITGNHSSATATVGTLTEGSIDIRNKYFFDDGQRDNFYDISRIIRKSSSPAPTGRLLIVYDYFEHGAGDLFTVDSYVDVSGQMGYDDIPVYIANKVDPDSPAPAGEFDLRETADFRPKVEDIAGSSSTLETVDEITGNSFDFFSRQYDGTGASTVDVGKAGSFIQSDLEFYLARKSTVIIDNRGVISVIDGASSEIPTRPDLPDNVMVLAHIDLPPFTFKPSDVRVTRVKNQRFTMKDIGKINERLKNVEKVTTLNLLEKNAAEFEVTDANGLNRFKSGFVVDNFRGHSVGDSFARDYKNSIDFEQGILRPTHVSKSVDLEESVSSDDARTGAGYKKTGDLITLPYTEKVLTEQPFASTVERVAPFLIANWEGILAISPTQDNWFETEIAPQLIINREGNFDAVVASLGNSIGTVWNSWQTTWAGVVTRGAGDDRQLDTENVERNPGRQFNAVQQSRTGTFTEVEEDFELESQGFRSVSKTLIPFTRAKDITFTANSLKPFTKLYIYFGGKVVNTYVTPDASGAFGTTFGSFSDLETPVAGSTLISDGRGDCRGVFSIPDPKISGNPQFPTGDIEFVITADPNNRQVGDGASEIVARETYAEALYSAKGILDTQQETIISTRNAIVRTTQLNQSTESLSRIESPLEGESSDGGDDPLAQTFLVLDKTKNDKDISGYFLTSVDIYYFEKDDTYPTWVEIRNVINGSPGPKILPFGRKLLQSDEVSLSNDGSVATTFTFDSPVYVKSQTEYCIVVRTDVPDYKVWIADLGTQDADGNEITEQPHVGVLFKSANNRSWGASQTQDLKFTLKRASFDTSAAGLVTLQNQALETKILTKNPLEMTDDNTALKINHNTHGMYSTSNNVTIDGVKSGASTTLNGALNATATSITLTSGTNFDDTSGKYSRDASNVYYIKIDDEIISYTTISGTGITSATRGANSTTATSHANGATVELFQIHKVPLYDINKTHTAIANISADSYTIVLATTPVVDGSGSTSTFGGTVCTATENAQYDVSTTNLGILVPPRTSIDGGFLTTSGTSVSGSETSFVKSTTTRTLPLNDNYYFSSTNLIASSINETNEMSGVKSLSIPITLSSELEALSPVIDTQRMSVVAVSNLIDKIDSSSDVYPTTVYKPMTEPEGDNHSAIYMTKKVNLETPATSLRVLLDINRDSLADVKVLFKTLRVDDAFSFDEIDYKFFNDDGTVAGSGGPDIAVRPAIRGEFLEHEYTAGVTDDGIGNPLDEFISFQIKIVMRTTNQASPPRVRNLRALALAT